MKHITKLIGTFALLGATVVASPALADTKTFKAGSLIIPATSVYQTDCGAVGMYGLIYNILRANVWLDADPGYGPIEIYYTFDPDKASPNRCTPTNLHTNPGGSTSVSWTDGCDFSLSDSSGTTDIVKLAANNTAATNNAKITTINTSAKTNAYPTYGVAQDITALAGVTTVRYWGGSFVIDATDADTFMGLVRGEIAAKDNGVLINFAPFRQVSGSSPAACNYHSDWKNVLASVGGWVNIHRSFVDFTAPIPKRFDSAPPRLALLALDSAADGTGTVSDNILQGYLSRAGLKFAGANGCPPGSPHAGNPTICPNGGVNGEIYDTFDFKDILDNRLDNTIYKMFWAPHWEFKSTAGPTTDEKTAITKISTFLEGKTGLMGECASINNFEGSTIAVTDTQGKFQTCQNDGSGACSSTFNSRGLSVNSGGGYKSDPSNTTLRNCSDINLAGGSDCYYVSYPGDSYAQFGDFRWVSNDGIVSDFLSNTGSNQMYKPGVLPLVSGVTSLDITKLTSPAVARASGLLKGDYVSRSTKDNLDTKGNILYLGGHDLTASVAGTKVVLQTLLQLGTTDALTRTVEVSRAMPIPTTIGVVQGTYESVQPAAGTPRKMLLDSDASSFEFPFTKGHLRAYTNVSATATTFTTLGAATGVWDTSGAVSGIPNIPVADYDGCTPYNLSCRTVFTNLVTNCSPTTTPCASTVFSDTTAPALGVLMANDLNATSKQTLVRRTLEGVIASTAPNGYKAVLGGIDRSTAAVIPASSLAGVGTRPTMIYVGGTDGMMHAICGDNVSPCTAGRELWAFMPRNQLSSVRTNTTRIDGSPRVQDLYGDFDGNGKQFRTVLVFQTASGDGATMATAPAVYALDVTDPDAPTILWEHTTPGRGLAITMGRLSSGKLAAFAQTNSGTTTAGSVVTAIDVETGLSLWTNTLVYPAPRTVSRLVPATGIPGGAVGIDLTGSGSITDVVFSTLYGQIYRLDADTGVNPYDPSPLFQFTTDLKPFGAAPSIFASGGLYAVAASGGYVDYDTDVNPLWTSSSTMQQAVAVKIAATAPPITEVLTPPNPDLKFAYDLTSGQLSFSQVQIIGEEIFITTDSTDVNASTYGTTSVDSGKAHRIDLNGGAATVVNIVGGAASVGHSGSVIYAATGDKAQTISALTATDPEAGQGINGNAASKVTRRLWLRTL